MKENIELIPYPNFEDVFVSEIDPKAKYVFLPLITIKVSNHSVIGTKTFHLISIWDTGNYKKEYFGNFRTDVNAISFNIVGDKLEYKDEIKFPKIEFLEEAYKIIVEDFKTQRDYYLENLEYESQSAKMDRGVKLILDKLPEFGDFESGYYFERITSALLSKYRFEKYGAVNSLFNDNAIYIDEITNGKYSEEQLKTMDFNKIGKINLVDNLLEQPEFEQNEEFPEKSLFIGQINEWHYISASSTNTYLFFDKTNNKEMQIFQWD